VWSIVPVCESGLVRYGTESMSRNVGLFALAFSAMVNSALTSFLESRLVCRLCHLTDGELHRR